MTEERIREYLNQGGKLFIVITIDTMRDGGTKVIGTTTAGKIYVHKDSKKFHADYPPVDENLIRDSLLIEYIIDRIELYLKMCEEQLHQNKNLLTEIRELHGEKKKYEPDWRIGKYYISKSFEVVQFSGCGSGQHALLGNGRDYEDAQRILKNYTSDCELVETRIIKGIMYYDYRLKPRSRKT